MRDLTHDEIEALLNQQQTGHLGLYDKSKDRSYVVPVSYVYNGKAIHLHSAPGLKLNLLKAHPLGVCFQADAIADEGDWLSVIVWGHFEEVQAPEERMAILRSFGSRLQRGPLRDRQNAGRGGMLGAGETVYRIVIEEVSGRADESGWAPVQSD